MLLSTLLEGLDDACVIRDCEVVGIAYDSRKVEVGDLFVAIKGYQFDGHDFVGDALLRGASGVVVQDQVDIPQDKGIAVVKDSRFALSHLGCVYYGNPSKDLLVVGVTGTKGKTTTCHMVKEFLDSIGYRTGLIGTVHNIIGGEVLPVTHTTPESLDLLAMHREMVDRGCTAVVMEVSSHALELSRVAHVQFDVGVFTNIGTDHLDFHNTLENYVAAKRRFFQLLAKTPTSAQGVLPFAVINHDDPFWDYFASAGPRDFITYGIDQESDVRAIDVETGAKGSRFTLLFKGSKKEAEIHLPGRFNVYNALAASAVSLGLGMNIEEVVEVLRRLSGVKGRAELVSGEEEYAVWVDYAHTPESLRDILLTAKQVADNRVIVVFGCGGDRDKGKRPIMGKIAGEIADVVIITNDNPRTEDEDEILDQIQVGLAQAQMEKPQLAFYRIKDRAQAIEKAIWLAEKGDVVVIAGKGHETYQIFKDKTVHFDDAEVARKAIDDSKKSRGV
ncbi:MAG TPA: UDP-N-acetylmuramoyl-L-alanyl-D-glutamate--2,6-diaminopimelate ligase [Bacillota bacterium]|nr:UDP-N-acetylmuramoyl-L-alanyl-D-glutamate--2,6-diaminopimelate ligase [Candidatus Fermentithermobacillaceae bacterium]HOB29911.1 UDP-N-acetylmuramoyl-L-alanyl-D-glutamate--2,6-diaminopimelate ligase [Bacillota bacterium]HOK63781.1 UDP-N-acetylmuramoyl-L-alanyl-D-glutamate--2,6-diaminopimelate ligase [Bacillota bacterium]HOL11531.1 UDP-N-acetylmuramoyl-L-alanyl-D-glutamate--2,6-diaminopimelate ligase [Bacillota bacterium]HOQ02588.1 UDP-N-acetylmuramoyl-L-alanyl-D-glutamate--2,6-diaminopimelat